MWSSVEAEEDGTLNNYAAEESADMTKGKTDDDADDSGKDDNDDKDDKDGAATFAVAGATMAAAAFMF